MTLTEIADLVVASTRDWLVPPVQIQRAYLYDPSDLVSTRPGIAAKARASQERLVQWIKDTLKNSADR